MTRQYSETALATLDQQPQQLSADGAKASATVLPMRLLRLDEGQAGLRLDQALAERLPEFSRSRIQQWIEQGNAKVDGRQRRSRYRVRGGEEVALTPVLEVEQHAIAQPIALDVVAEDAHLLVLNKPAGLVVHPAAGNPDGTLLNALLHYDPTLARLPRCGIVHRLDKETSGLLVVARSLPAHQSLVGQLQARTMGREYLALVVGNVPAAARIDAAIGRHQVQRKRMAVVTGGRPAVSDYRPVERFRGHTLLAVTLSTGRTHQIRVHMRHAGYPLVGDPVYGARPKPPRAADPALAAALRFFPRQALHARRLTLKHPVTDESLAWEASVPEDLDGLLRLLRADVADNRG
jgi:23S rRNA pseudouridine1911/1915/1917 synthase